MDTVNKGPRDAAVHGGASHTLGWLPARSPGSLDAWTVSSLVDVADAVQRGEVEVLRRLLGVAAPP